MKLFNYGGVSDIMESLMGVLTAIQGIVWGPPTLILLLGVGLYLTVRLNFLQVRKLPKAIQYIFEKDAEEGDGDVSAFASLCAAAAVGTGSIVGVATALRTGGPGALFWMWVSAFLGMVTKYAEGLLAVKYRTVDENGQIAGGPMYYIEKGLGIKWKPLAKIFAFFGIVTAMLGCGTFPQVNAITESTSQAFHVPVAAVGIIVTVVVASVVLGGVKSISSAAKLIIPFMTVFYVAGCAIILCFNHDAIAGTFSLIFQSAFQPSSVAGGIAGTAVISVMTAMRTGVARGVYTNEAGLGSSPIMAAAAKTKSCVKQGLISMTSVFFTTIIICTMTGIVVLSSGLLETTDLNGGLLTNAAFNMSLPGNVGMYMVTLGLIFFSFVTIVSWCYYGERCLVYLSGSVKWIKPYKVMYIACIALAPFLSLEPIWLLADITNACMAFPNLVAIMILSPVVISETKLFFDAVNKKVTAPVLDPAR